MNWIREPLAPLGFDRLYGLELVDLSPDRALARVEVRDELKQPYGVVHGGVYAALAESLASIATAVAVAAENRIALGLSNQTSFLRPITEGSIHAVRYGQASRPEHLGLGGRDVRRPRTCLRAHADDDRDQRGARIARSGGRAQRAAPPVAAPFVWPRTAGRSGELLDRFAQLIGQQVRCQLSAS